MRHTSQISLLELEVDLNIYSRGCIMRYAYVAPHFEA